FFGGGSLLPLDFDFFVARSVTGGGAYTPRMPPAAGVPMVMIVNPPRMHPVSFGGIGSALVSGADSGGSAVGPRGGGRAASFRAFGPYGDLKLWFAVDVRVRLLDDLAYTHGLARMPIDVLARTTLIPSYTTRPVPCRLPPGSPPDAICLGVDREEPFPLQP